MTEAAYFAGLFDGEGCISLTNNRIRGATASANYQLICRVKMTDFRPIEALYASFGGSLRREKIRSGRPCLVWVTRSLRAEDFLQVVLPYLLVKREQAECALAFCALRRAQRRDAKITERCTQEMLAERLGYVRRLKELKAPPVMGGAHA